MAIYPASGTGAWEAALANTMSPGDAVLMFETGHFATLWQKMALRLGLQPEFLAVPGSDAGTGLPSGWRRGVQADLIEQRLRADTQHRIKAVCVVHNETSTGVTSDIAAVRRAIDAAGHPALLMVDTISGLASADFRHDEWGVDVPISGSQKGLMLPPGISFNALSPKALEARKTREAAALVLGLGRDRRDEQGRLLAVHAQHQPAVRPVRGAGHAARAGAATRCSRATSAGPRACAPRCAPGACRSSAPTRRCIRRC